MMHISIAFECRATDTQKLHDKLVASVLSATISWFDATPVGRITNRFSTDIEEVDKEMMFTLQNFLDCVLGTAQVLIAVGEPSQPQFLTVSDELCFIFQR